MAPLSDEPDVIRVVLNMARRKAFYGLVAEITAYMRSQLELQHPEGREDIEEASPPPYSASDALRTGSTASASSPRREGSQENGSRRPVPSPHSPALVRLRRAALLHFDSWRAETLGRLKEIVVKADDQKVVDARRKRTEKLKARAKEEPVGESEDLLSFDSSASIPASTSQPPTGHGHGYDSKANKELEAFQSLYHPIPTRLITIPLRDREEALSATLLLLLSAGNYSAYSRTLICYLASALGIAPSTLDAEETAIATTMVETAQKANAGMSADTEAQKRRDEGRTARLWKVGLASVAGAAIVGVTGGLAAPVVAATVGGLMSSVGLGGLAGFLGIFWMNGALVGTLFGAFGAKMTGEIVDRYAKEVEDFKFLPLSAEWGARWRRQGNAAAADARRLRVTIGINGWLDTEDDVARPWRVLGDETEVFALRYEMASLMSLGQQLRALVGSAAWNLVRAEILRRTVLVTLQTALWPILLLNSASSIDNPFSLARNRSEKAGDILADALINRVQGERPVTLIGYSLGARVIYACLRALAERRAFGLVDTVVLIGAPVPSNAAHWHVMRGVVAGKLFNVHSANDYILGFLYRGTSLQLGVAGLQAVGADIHGVEDLDLSDDVHGHLRYPGLIAQILHRCGFANVRGGHTAIEKEDSPVGIQLRDKDYPQLGNLIDIDDDAEIGPPPPLPPRRTTREMANEKFDPVVKSVLEQKSDARTLDLKIMGSGTKSGLNQPGPPMSWSSPDLRERPSSLGGRVDSTRIEDRSASLSHRAAPDRASTSQHIRGCNDGDGEGYGERPIVMRDDDEEISDGELTMVEPLSIDDEPLR